MPAPYRFTSVSTATALNQNIAHLNFFDNVFQLRFRTPQHMSRSDLNISRWLEAHLDRSAGLTTLPGNLVLADVSGDGDHRLVLTDIKLSNEERSRLKVYKGTVLVSDQTLPNAPSAIVSFYTDNYDSKIPAVACGSDLLIYKNNKPYFKFTLPSLPITALEQDVWKKISSESGTDLDQAVETLKTVPFPSLSSRSQKLLSLQPPEREDYVKRYANADLTKMSPITCMTVLYRSTQDKFSPACPVLATESGQIFFLDPQLLTILHQATVCNTKATPSILRAVGTFDVEFRLVVACREGFVCLLRRGWVEGRVLLQSTSNIVDVALMPGDNFIMLATSNKTLQCYTKRGNKVWSQTTNNDVTCLCLVSLKHLSTSLLAVGMRGGAVHLYQGRHLVDVMVAPETPSVIIFGHMGQEEHVMIIITLAGTINFKILKRTADFNLSKNDSISSPAAVQTKPLPLPKRSKLFLEQSMRERQNAVEMHQNFQKDLIRLRLTAARATVQIQSDQSGIGNEKELIKLSAQVLGLGPKFTLILSLENMNSVKALCGFTVIFHTKPTAYKLSACLINVPLIPPGLSYKMETKVEECGTVEGDGNEQEGNAQQSQIIRVFVIRKEESQPVLAAAINMPPTDIAAALL